MGERGEWRAASLRLVRRRRGNLEERFSGDFSKKAALAGGRGSSQDLLGDHLINKGSTEKVLQGVPQRQRLGVGGEGRVEGKSPGFVRQTQTAHRLPRSYYHQERIYKIASTGDLATKAEELGRERRSQRFPASR